ncbi:MAG: acetylornithine transaminase [Actinomycetota bacterium]
MRVETSAGALMDSYRRWPVTFVEGRGARLTDAQGKTYIDLLAGIAVASVGHCHPKVTAAIAQQASRLVHVSNLYENPSSLAVAERLAELTGGMKAFFANSGAEAIECALKLARKHAGGERVRIVAAEGGFHGRTFGALSATGQPSKQAPFQPLVPGFVHVGFGDPGAIERELLAGDVAAVLLEPVQGEAGVVVPAPGYLAAVRDLCDRHGALLILDEVQTGLGRTGAWFGFEHAGVTPDILCLAKALAGGLPMGACLAQPEIAAAFVPGDHATTFGGGPVQSAAALAVLQVIEEEGLVERARAIGDRLRSGLSAAFGGSNVRGLGALLAIQLDAPVARELAAAALERGVLVNDIGDSVIRLSPPLVITDPDIDRAVELLGEAWHEVSAS